MQLEGVLPLHPLARFAGLLCAAEAVLDGGGQRGQGRQLVEPAVLVIAQRGPQDARGAGVDGVDAALGVEHDHARAHRVEDGLQLAPLAVQRGGAGLGLAAGVGELARHLGEGSGQAAQLIA